MPNYARYPNGALPRSILAPIPGGHLREDAAASWNHLCAEARRLGLVVPMPSGRDEVCTYRDLAEQRNRRRIQLAGGPVAADPGTSNHGWGVAADILAAGWATLRRLGPRHGFTHEEGARVGEGWHYSNPAGRNARFPSFPAPLPTIRKGSKRSRDVKHLQVLLRDCVLGRYLPRGWRATTSYALPVRRAVRKFQREHDLKADGVVGPTTWRVLRASYDRRHRR